MKQSFYVAPQVWAFLGLPILSFLAGILLLVLKEWYPALACLIIFLLFSLILIIWRKVFFSKIEISNDGISKIYGKKLINHISWKDIYEIRALPKYFIYFLNKPFDDKTLLDYKSNICFWLTNKKLNILLSYKEKFQNKITDISILNKHHQDLLLN